MIIPKTLVMTFAILFGLISWSQKTFEPKMVSTEQTLDDVKIQPAAALEIADPYLEKHATDHWNPEKPLQTHIVRKGDNYYISKTNYPAKSIYYYLQPAVKVNCQTGEVSLIEKDDTQKKKKN